MTVCTCMYMYGANCVLNLFLSASGSSGNDDNEESFGSTRSSSNLTITASSIYWRNKVMYINDCVSENIIKIGGDFGAIFRKKAWAIVQGIFIFWHIFKNDEI